MDIFMEGCFNLNYGKRVMSLAYGKENVVLDADLDVSLSVTFKRK